MSPNSTINSLLFSPAAVIHFGGNRFVHVPVILQVDDTPLIEAVPHNEISLTTRFTIFHGDGVLLATAVGTRLFCTVDGVKAGIEMQYPERATICLLGGRRLFEVRRIAAAALTITAELYSPAGLLVSSNAAVPLEVRAHDGTPLAVAGAGGRRISNTPVGFSVTNQGRSVALGGT